MADIRASLTPAHVGTSGWGYPSWQPGFYPVGLDRSAFLPFYAKHLDAVELNVTKYRLPSEEQFRSWATQVPDGFRFAVKAPDGVERRLATFEERVQGLAGSLGCVRVVVDRPRDDGFLELLLGSIDPGIRYALDLRDPTWDGVEDRLTEARAVRVGDMTGRAGWAYVRFRELLYERSELELIADQLGVLTRSNIEAFAFFRHGEEPDAVRSAVHVATGQGSPEMSNDGQADLSAGDPRAR